MRPKLSDGKWKDPFDVLSTHGQGFIEGNAWNYSLYVPQDIPDMIRIMGGERKFTRHLDSLFTMHLADEHFKETEDITRDGIIGCYVHGNEPGHHIPYLYNWAGQPGKTQMQVRNIMNTMYAPAPDGLCGNDDCGQMSAWYIFSALGFYPVCPGSTEYALGSPLVVSASIHFENGKTLEIKTVDQSPENLLVKEVRLNNVKITGNSIDHKMLTEGGTLTFFIKK
jgi:predicted alpha-1,2-mannosidase